MAEVSRRSDNRLDRRRGHPRRPGESGDRGHWTCRDLAHFGGISCGESVRNRDDSRHDIRDGCSYGSLREHVRDRLKGKLDRQDVGYRSYGVGYRFHNLGYRLNNPDHWLHDCFGRVRQRSVSNGADGIGGPGQGAIRKRLSKWEAAQGGVNRFDDIRHNRGHDGHRWGVHWHGRSGSRSWRRTGRRLFGRGRHNGRRQCFGEGRRIDRGKWRRCNSRRGLGSSLCFMGRRGDQRANAACHAFPTAFDGRDSRRNGAPNRASLVGIVGIGGRGGHSQPGHSSGAGQENRAQRAQRRPRQSRNGHAYHPQELTETIDDRLQPKPAPK